jgi:Formylglycinamide ribonucleotide amidotransferase N-terminal
MTSHGKFFALAGPGALSPFRSERLLARVRSVALGATAIDARFVHFVHAARPLDEHEEARLAALLTYGEVAAEPPAGAAQFLVVPRLGTISPWASKATDIARNTGLAAVLRIERGTLFGVAMNGAPGGTAGLAPAAADAVAARRSRCGRKGVMRWRAPTSRWAWRCRTTRSTTSSTHSRSSGATRPTSN